MAESERSIVIGAGPAGLCAALELTKQGIAPIVFEKDDIVGGISRTQNYKGFHFDMGGHRFYTKSEEVKALWKEVIGDEFLVRPRLSRIFYEQKFFKYPPEPVDAMMGLGVVESAQVVLSYMRWKLFPHRDVETFEQWVTNAFGQRLFSIFFKTYTEKVWGIPCSELRAEWAAQRIRNLSLRTVIQNFFQKGTGNVKSLIERFHYPRLGPGMMWTAFAEAVETAGGEVRMQSGVWKIRHDGQRALSVVAGPAGKETEIPAQHVFSSMPVTQLIKSLDPLPPEDVLKAADTLRYRDFLTVCLIIDKEDLFPDNWIYVHDSTVNVGRIQCFKNWSPDMVPDQSKTSLGLEYFCNEGDEVWTMDDADLIELAKTELEKIGLAEAKYVTDGVVYRIPKSYPVYDADYADALAVIREYLDRFENMQTVGRNGLHRYNNQDHSMLTGVHAVRNMILGQNVDIWRINGEDDYLEEIVEDKPGLKAAAE